MFFPLRAETIVHADAVIVATGAVARRMDFKGEMLNLNIFFDAPFLVAGSGEGEGGFWNKGISACAVCDGAAPIFRKVCHVGLRVTFCLCEDVNDAVEKFTC